jgi:hypothetical protein
LNGIDNAACIVELGFGKGGCEFVAEIDRRKSSVDILEHVSHGFHAVPKRRPPATAEDRPRRERRSSRKRKHAKKADQ